MFRAGRVFLSAEYRQAYVQSAYTQGGADLFTQVTRNVWFCIVCMVFMLCSSLRSCKCGSTDGAS